MFIANLYVMSPLFCIAAKKRKSSAHYLRKIRLLMHLCGYRKLSEAVLDVMAFKPLQVDRDRRLDGT